MNAPTAPPQDPNAQWLDAVLYLRQELKFETRDESGKTFVVVEDPVRNKFFQIGTTEYRLLSYIDGKRSIKQIVAESDEGSFTDDFAAQVSQWLVQTNLAYSDSIDSSKRINAQLKSIKKAGLIGKLNPISFKVKLFNPTRALHAIFPVAKLAFTKPSFAIWIITAIIALRTIFVHWDEMGSSSAGILSGSGWIWLLVFWLLLKVVHEAAHGIACRKYGGEVPEAGVLFLLFTPMAYVNVTSMWRFSSRWHRIVVAAAGMYVELFISFISVIVWSRTDGLVADTAFNLFIMSSVTTILFNANPLMRFDGYFILSDLLGVANLYPKGTKWFGDRLKSMFFGIPLTPNIIPQGEFFRCAIYGTMAFFWKLLIAVSLTIGASVLMPNFGIFLAVIGGALWIGMPLYQQYQQTLGSKAKHKVCPKRVGISVAVLSAVAAIFFFALSAPATKSAPAIVQFAKETVLRAESSGFLDEILVESGSTVKAGQTIARLRNRELLDEVSNLSWQAEASRIQVRMHKQDGEMGLMRIEQEKLAGLEKQLAEKQLMAESLEVKAPFDGFVFQRQLSNKIGSFVEAGDPIVNMARRQTKEIVVLIDQQDLDSVKENEGQPIRVLISGMSVFRSRFNSINPRATVTPNYPTLCAFAGGSLPVKAASDKTDGEPAFELLSPRFEAELSLDDEISKSLHSGQRGLAFFKTNRQSMGSYLYLAACDWLKNKIEIATQM
jgi:putative peptide zinc metalloprotease protein